MKKFDIRKFASNIAISFFFSAIFVLCYYFIFEDKVSEYVALANIMSVKQSDKETEVKYDINSKSLIRYPAYGKKYASLIIPSIDLKLAVYHGDNIKILRHGVGHYSGSYFPGENGTIIYAAHNTKGFFQKLDKVKIGDKITIKTSYGTFEYKVYKHKVVDEKNLKAFDIQHEKEILILYTCYPINRSVVGRKTKRYVVYASKVGFKNE